MKTKLENGQKFAPQFRTISLRAHGEGEGQRVSVDMEERMVIGVSVSSDEPYDRYYGKEILVHTPEAVDLTRFKKKAAPLLLNHDRNQQIGKPLNPRLEDGRLIVDLKFSQNAMGMDALRDLEDGILTECSIGYAVTKFEVDEEEETYTATKWEVFECSMVSIPADYTVGVGRDLGVEEQRIEITPKNNVDESRKNENKISQQRETSQNREKNMDPLTPEQIEAKAATAKAEGQREERERVGKIQELSRHFAEKGLGGRKIDTNELAAKYIAEGKMVAEFRDAVMEGTFEDVKPIQTPDQRDLGDNPRIQVVGERGADPRGRTRGLSIGEEFVRSSQFKEASKSGGQGKRNASLEIKDVTMLGARGKASLAYRAGWTSSDLSAVNIQPIPGLIGLGVQRLTIMDMLAGGVTDAAALPYAKENSFGTVNGVAPTAGTYPRAQTVGEGGVKPRWNPDLTTDVANVKKVAVLTSVPDEFMADFAGMRSYIDERLPYMVDLETEFQLLYGDNLGNNLKGIFANTGIQTRAIDATSDSTVAASLKKGLTDIAVGSQFEPTAYAFHPYDWETASLLKDTTGRFLAGGPFYIPYTGGVYVEMNTFWGKPVVISTSVNYGKPVAGAWKLGAQYFVREGMRLETSNSNKDDFERNLISIRAEHRLALATYRPPSFLEFTGFPART